METTLDHFGPLFFHENQNWRINLCRSSFLVMKNPKPFWTTLDQFTNSNQKQEIFINDNNTTGQF